MNYLGSFETLLYSSIRIKKAGCYELALNSDVGSILWLDEQKVLDNDGLHQMRLRKTQLFLDAKEYAAKLWYFDGAPPLQGLQFWMERLGGKELCRLESVKPEEGKVTLSGASLFASGEDVLSAKSKTSLDSLCERLQNKRIMVLRVVGHIDNVGDSLANRRLSVRRARTVLYAFKDCLDLTQASIEFSGAGESTPVADNETEAGRALNRRVEISIE